MTRRKMAFHILSDLLNGIEDADYFKNIEDTYDYSFLWEVENACKTRELQQWNRIRDERIKLGKIDVEKLNCVTEFFERQKYLSELSETPEFKKQVKTLADETAKTLLKWSAFAFEIFEGKPHVENYASEILDISISPVKFEETYFESIYPITLYFSAVALAEIILGYAEIHQCQAIKSRGDEPCGNYFIRDLKAPKPREYCSSACRNRAFTRVKRRCIVDD